MVRARHVSMIAVCALVASGCGNRDDPGSEFAFFGGGRVNVGGPNQMLDPRIERYDDLALIYLLNPNQDMTDKPKNVRLKDAEWTRALRMAFAKANDRGPENRDRIQEQLILASNQGCNYYKDYLRRLDSYKSFFLGSLTTILGGASAIVTGVGAARTLGGSAPQRE